MPHPLVEEPSYGTVHQRLFYSRGRASGYTCPCGKQAQDWAYDHSDPNARVDEKGRSFSEDLERYNAMCVTCHRALDAKDNCPKGHPYTAENTYTHAGHRLCRMCRRDWQRQRRRSANG